MLLKLFFEPIQALGNVIEGLSVQMKRFAF
jgi:hypothetical protein